MLAKKLESAAKAVESAYIEDVFSTYVYTGVGTNTWNNGIDLSTKGGAVWVKCRSQAYDNVLFDTVRGASKQLITNATGAETTTNGVNAFTTTGFSTGSFNNETSLGGEKYASWTFRKQPKFFDIVTYTGDGTNRTIAHNLGSVPGCIIVKKTSGADNWFVQHRSLGATKYIALNDPDIAYTNSQLWNNTEPTSTVFTLGTNSGVNQSGSTYVAYLFAHNAGGFGLTGSDNVISCGSYTGNGSTIGPVVTLGYEPQWLLIKSATDATDWNVVDSMRGLWVGDTSATGHSPRLRTNLSNAEQVSGFVIPTATGFQLYGPNAAASAYNGLGSTYIYIAIRRGPMKAPTTGTSVFAPVAYTGNNSIRTITAGFPIDADLNMVRSSAAGHPLVSRLTGGRDMDTANTGSEGTAYTAYLGFDNQTGLSFKDATGYSYYNSSANTYIAEMFRRAPSFFDMVCYAGTSTNRYQQHSLTVVPELIFVKCRNSASTGWLTYSATIGPTKYMKLNTIDSATTDSTFWNDLSPTSTTFSLGLSAEVNSNSVNQTYVAYLFASCPGVSKVGSYTGNGSSQTINCGFTGGARFVLIKRTDNTGDWYVWDTARGIVSGNDPHLSLNTTDAEVTTDDTIDPASIGFIVNQLSATNVNVSSATYIYLAIA